MLTLFPGEEASRQYIEEIVVHMDVIVVINYSFTKGNEVNCELIQRKRKCISEKLYSANAFRDVVDYLKQRRLILIYQ